ncbi:MAG: epoxyqueuosine reductase QueH [Candidatus Ozemobacteraceae bacterium]
MMLVHACCGPCLGGAHGALVQTGHTLVAFWENPNIHPYLEYRSRLEAFNKLVQELHLPVVYGDLAYAPERFFGALTSFAAPVRCMVCFRLRLDAAACRARSLGCEAFTTTLQISPYQNREMLLKAANEAAATHATPFFEIDLRSEFPKTHLVAREKNLYKQKYCGCLFSEQDRYAHDIRFALPPCMDTGLEMREKAT